ncbi:MULTISPECIES: hypothetical protein [Streptomyces]|uniref:Uncharacterized protein n=1 Tax=Streptomyces dengpaensis TaxID=2049881 RepID=A0ABM6SXW0_9ACTN|nr:MULTISPECIES: hypothetical protein [Streptomyces]AVH59728.1 hypothetical protein C4B68_32690 [Streptomyces dengpaensis]PIB09372.1 hypothetical protein B1C81_09370 [Streptomyces sp. HG99]
MTADIPTQLRRRHSAALRTAQRDCGCPHAFHADPLNCLAAPPRASTFSLDARRLITEVRKLRALGWTPDEIRQVLDLSLILPTPRDPLESLR